MSTTIMQPVKKINEIEKAMAAKELNAEIRRLLDKKGWNQDDLGERIGLSQSRISRMLKGERDFDLETIYRLSVAFDTSPFELAAIYWGIEVEQLSNKDKELLNNMLRLFNDYRKDATGWKPNEQAEQGLVDADIVSDQREVQKKKPTPAPKRSEPPGEEAH